MFQDKSIRLAQVNRYTFLVHSMLS